jgi:hypothetical protein
MVGLRRFELRLAGRAHAAVFWLCIIGLGAVLIVR